MILLNSIIIVTVLVAVVVIAILILIIRGKNRRIKAVIDTLGDEYVHQDESYSITNIQNERRKYQDKLEEVKDTLGEDYQNDICSSITNLLNDRDKYKKLNDDRNELLEKVLTEDNIKTFPYIASLIADYKTIDIVKF